MGKLAATVLSFLASVGARADENTTIRETGFTLQLPGHWVPQPRKVPSDAFIYTCRKYEEQIVVTVLQASPLLSTPELRDVLNTVIQARRSAEANLDPAMDLMDTRFSEVNAGVTGFYQGRNKSGRYIANYSIVNQTGTLNIYYQALKIPPKEFATRVGAVLSDVSFIEISK